MAFLDFRCWQITPKFLPRDAPADNIPFVELQSINAKVHQYVSQRGIGEFSVERLMMATQQQKYSDMDFIPPAVHQSFEVGTQRYYQASNDSGNAVNRFFTCSTTPGDDVCMSANRTLDGTIVSLDGMSAYLNKEDEIYIQAWSRRKKSLYWLYLHPIYKDYRLSKYFNPRNASQAAVQYVVPCNPTYNTCETYTKTRAVQAVQDFWDYPSNSYYDYSGKAGLEYNYIHRIETSYFAFLHMQLYYDGAFPVWSFPFVPQANVIQYRWEWYSPWQIDRWFN